MKGHMHMPKRILTQPSGNGSVDRTGPDKPARIANQAPTPTPTSPEPEKSTSNPARPDLFADLERLRLKQDFLTTVGVKKQLLTVPVRKPSREWFVRTHPTMRITTCVLELKEDREIYIVSPDIWHELASEPTFGPRALFLAMSKQGVLFIWPVRLPGPDGRIDSWNRSGLEAATMAADSWVRVSANMALGAYDVYKATADYPPPEWPDMGFAEILKVAFKDFEISNLGDRVLQRLRGEG
jgi:hypothetical protein